MNNIFSTSRSSRTAQRPGRQETAEQLEILLDGEAYPLTIRTYPRARSIGLSADVVKGEVRLTVPRGASHRQAIQFAQSKSSWLAERFAEALPPVPLINGAEISFAGESHRIRWDPQHPRKPRRLDMEIRLGGPEERIAARLIDWLKEEARKAFAADLAEYCARADVELPQLSVGDARRRWGSCSGRGAIRLNWRLIMAPPMVRRSVVAHEVAHLRHMNHSPEFYAELDRIFEGRRAIADRWLKQHGAALHLIGASPREQASREPAIS